MGTHFEWSDLYWFIGISFAILCIGIVAFFIHASSDTSSKYDVQVAQTTCSIPKISVLKGTTITLTCGGQQP